MKCKKCGKTISEHLELGKYLKEALDELKDKPCRELINAYFGIEYSGPCYHDAAKIILLERGHSKKELGLE